jgi:hypothetical protein
VEATIEPEPVAPEAGAVHVEGEPPAEGAEGGGEGEQEEEISLEAILRDLKRREGRE